MTQRVATHLMFAGTAAAALELYAATFPEFSILRMDKYGAGEPGPEGTVKIAEASFKGHTLVVIDSPVTHAFTFTPATSLFVDCESVGELDAAFATLSAGGQVFMPLNNYGFSRRFGWCTDRFGVSWQLNLP
jgi:predicted 3-demethylubiquinone-9 3-methyltransferase (glyoxalase superfamily)